MRNSGNSAVGRIGNEPRRDSCQSTGGGDTPEGAPWRGAPREQDKTRLWRYVAGAPDGTPLSLVVSHVFGAAAGDYSNTDYKLARRFFERHEEFRIERRDGDVWVWPSLDGFHLTRSKQSVGTQEGGGVALSNADALVSKVGSIESDSVRASLLRTHAAKRAATEDKMNILKRVRGDGAPWVLTEFVTRFNSSDRVGASRARFSETWDVASERFDSAVMVTLTTDPSLFDSIADAAASLLPNRNDLGRFLSYEPESGPSRPGFRPPSIAVPEFTERGLPHLHIVYFGVSWLTTHSALSSYLGDKQGRVVHLDRLSNRNGTWVFSNRGERREGREERVGVGDAQRVMADGGRPTADAYDGGREREPRGSVAGYLSKGLRSLAEFADSSPAELRERADALAAGRSGRDEFWKLALYWATGTRMFTRSPGLREPKDDGEGDSRLPYISCYEVVGAAQYGQIPGYIRERGVILTRSGDSLDPPPG